MIRGLGNVSANTTVDLSKMILFVTLVVYSSTSPCTTMCRIGPGKVHELCALSDWNGSEMIGQHIELAAGDPPFPGSYEIHTISPILPGVARAGYPPET